LNANERNEPEIAVTPKAGEQRRHIDPCVRFVHGLDVDGDIRPEDLPFDAIGRNTVDGGEGIRGDHPAPPADHVSVVVIVRRLDENQLKAALCGRRRELRQGYAPSSALHYPHAERTNLLWWDHRRPTHMKDAEKSNVAERRTNLVSQFRSSPKLAARLMRVRNQRDTSSAILDF
jgi:hypothetical protein